MRVPSANTHQISEYEFIKLILRLPLLPDASSYQVNFYVHSEGYLPVILNTSTEGLPKGWGAMGAKY